MISHYLKVAPVRPGWRSFELAGRGSGQALVIDSPRYDNGSWFHKDLLLSLTIEPAGRSVVDLFYHPNASNFKYILDTSAHSAVDFAVFAGTVGGMLYRGRGASLAKDRSRLDKASAAVKNIYQTSSAARSADEGVSILLDHVKYLMHPSAFSEEGYYDSEKNLWHVGSIHKNEVFHGEVPS